MGDGETGWGETDRAAMTVLLRQLRQAIASEPEVSQAQGWREDLRLFAIAWAAGFVFFLILLA